MNQTMQDRPIQAKATLGDKYQSRLLKYLLSLLLMFNFGITSEAAQIVYLNNIKQQSDETYTITGIDPFFIFELDASEQVRQNKARAEHIELDLSLVTPKNVNGLAIEVFFKPLDSEAEPNGKQQFNPLYRFKLKIPTPVTKANTGKLLIAIPDDVRLSAAQYLRVDIDRCASCVLRVKGGPKLINRLDTETPAANQVFAYRVFNGAKPLPKIGYNIDSSNWHLNDIVRLNDRLEIDGGDPYLVSQNLDLNTQDLGGILFSFKYHEGHQKPRNYKLFYATDAHSFTENASSSVRLADDNNGISRFVIPLPFLSESQPSVEIVERLRIDLSPFDNNNHNGWSLIQSTVLNKAQMAEYASLIPARIIHSKRQRARGAILLKNVMKKILSDPWFIVSYLILIIGTAIGFWRRFNN